MLTCPTDARADSNSVLGQTLQRTALWIQYRFFCIATSVHVNCGLSFKLCFICFALFILYIYCFTLGCRLGYMTCPTTQICLIKEGQGEHRPDGTAFRNNPLWKSLNVMSLDLERTQISPLPKRLLCSYRVLIQPLPAWIYLLPRPIHYHDNIPTWQAHTHSAVKPN